MTKNPLLRNWRDFDISKVRTVNHGSESVRYLCPKIWEIRPTHIKESDSIGNLLLKNGKQKLVHVGYFKSIYKIRLHIDLNINLLLCLHIFYKIVRTVLQQTCEMEIFAAAVNGF